MFLELCSHSGGVFGRSLQYGHKRVDVEMEMVLREGGVMDARQLGAH